jgi:hypothetical protein
MPVGKIPCASSWMASSAISFIVVLRRNQSKNDHVAAKIVKPQ